MNVNESVLIVEDEVHWQSIYRRVANRQGLTNIETAADLAGAEAILRRRCFAVAFVDVGLNVEDDRNVDGLRVMELIRTLGDETSIIVVTGRSGHDVVPITRDALKKHRAFDAVGKVPVEPEELQQLLVGALQEYKSREAGSRPAVHDVLRGTVDAQMWDDQTMRALRVGRGATGLYAFLDGLFARFLPVVARPDAPAVTVDPAAGIAHGAYWSRAIGQAVAVVLAPKARAAEVVAAGASPLDRYRLGEVLRSVTAGEAEGIVYALPKDDRDSFPLT